MRLFAAIFVTCTAAFTPPTSQGKRSAPNMALRVERSVSEGLRRLYRLAAIGAVQGLFAAAPEPVAEPAKRGLAALFGR